MCTDWNVFSKKLIIFPTDCCKLLPRESSRILLCHPLCALTRSRCATCLDATNICIIFCILLLTFSSFAPQLDATPKTEASAEQRMELQREVEALKVNLEKQVGAAMLFCRECAAQFQQNSLLKLNKLLFSFYSTFSE